MILLHHKGMNPIIGDGILGPFWTQRNIKIVHWQHFINTFLFEPFFCAISTLVVGNNISRVGSDRLDPSSPLSQRCVACNVCQETGGLPQCDLQVLRQPSWTRRIARDSRDSRAACKWRKWAAKCRPPKSSSSASQNILPPPLPPFSCPWALPPSPRARKTDHGRIQWRVSLEIYMAEFLPLNVPTNKT